MIDIKTMEYDAVLTTEDGTTYRLNDALLRLQWEAQINELAQRATLTVANFKLDSGYLMDMLKINCVITIYAACNSVEKAPVFEGKVWEWQYISGAQKELTVTAYDPFIHLQQSEDFKYYSAGMTTQAIIGDICSDWTIPLKYEWSQSIIHEKKVFSGDKICDIILGLLDEVQSKTGDKYVAQYRDGQLHVTGRGTNATVYRFDTENTISTSDKLTINDLVTRVKIIGKQNDDGRAAVEAIAEGDTRYGVLQKIVRRDTDKTLGAAKSEADALIKERGKPDETIQVIVPDVPFIKKGDKIEMAAGNLIGFFILRGITHNATVRQMTMTLERCA